MQISIKGLDKALLMFDDKKVRKATRMAINDGLTTGRKVASKEIRKDWNIKATRVNKELRSIKRAKNNDLKAIIRAKGRPISLVHFGAKWKRGRMTTTGTKSTRTKRSTRSGGVFVKIHKGKSTRLPHAFIAMMPNGHIGVMERSGRFGRRGDGNLEKIKSRSSITLASMFDQPGVMNPTVKAIGDRWSDRFDHHLNRLLK